MQLNSLALQCILLLKSNQVQPYIPYKQYIFSSINFKGRKMDSKDEFVRKMHSNLDQLNNKIHALVAKIEQTEEQLGDEYHQQVSVLKNKHDEIRKKLNHIEESGENAWEDMQAGVELAWKDINMGIDTAWDAISEAISSAKSRFK